MAGASLGDPAPAPECLLGVFGSHRAGAAAAANPALAT